MAFADYDSDGDLDIYVSNSGNPNSLLRNDQKTRNNWLKVKLIGTVSL